MQRQIEQDPAPAATATHRRARAERRSGAERRATVPVEPESVAAIADIDAAMLDHSPAAPATPAPYRLTYACCAGREDAGA